MASLITDILKEIGSIPSTATGWSSVSSNFLDSAADAAVDWLVSTVYDHAWARVAYKGIMLYTSARSRATAHGNSNRMLGLSVPKDLQGALNNSGTDAYSNSFAHSPVSWIGNIIMSPISAIKSGIIFGLETATKKTDASGSFKAVQLAFEQILASPNIEGVPICTASVTSSRDIDISEQLVIIQRGLKTDLFSPSLTAAEKGNKAYKTDNAVPRLKTWHIDGYLTANLELDQFFYLKPSLDFQSSFLDRCAKSRKPVLFKTSRGEFVFVQITNLTLTEEASYNNAIKISIELKEYNPYVVPNYADIIQAAKELL